MESLFLWAEHSWLGTVNNSLWAFAAFEALHLLALAVIGGAVLIVDLRMLGWVFPRQRVSEIAAEARPWLIGSIVTMFLTGIRCWRRWLTRRYYFNEAFRLKMHFVVGAALHVLRASADCAGRRGAREFNDGEGSGGRVRPAVVRRRHHGPGYWVLLSQSERPTAQPASTDNSAQECSSCGRPPRDSARRRRPGRPPSRADARARRRADSGRPCRSSPSSAFNRSRPARGPCTIAAAMAWLSVTIGLSDMRFSKPYSARICGQSVSSARRAPRRAPPRSRPAADTAPTAPFDSVAADERDAFLDRARDPIALDPARRAGSTRRPARSARRAAHRSAASAPAAPRPRRSSGQQVDAPPASAESPRSTDRVRCRLGPMLLV